MITNFILNNFKLKMKIKRLKLLGACILFTGIIFTNTQCQKSKGSNLNLSFLHDTKELPRINNTKHNSQQITDFKWPDGKKMAISLTFDDARLTQIDKGIPLLDKYDVKATFYVSPKPMMERLEGWKQAQRNGHDIGNHTLSHPCTGNFAFSRNNALEDRTLKSLKTEIDSANVLIKEAFGVLPVSFAYPCGNTFVGRGINTKSYVPLIASQFETGRKWYDEGPNDPSFCDLSQLTGLELDGKSFDEILKLIESAKKNGQWLVLVGHEMNDEEGQLTSLLSTIEAICQYATDPANGIWIDNIHNIASFIKEQRGEK